MGDIIDILYVLQVLSPLVEMSTFVPSEEKVYVCVVCAFMCVCVSANAHLVWKPSLTDLHTRFFKIFLKKYQHFLWLSYISLGLTGIFVCVTSKHRLSVRRKEKRFVVGFVWLKKLTQLIQFSLGSLTGNFSFCIFKPISAFSWPKRLFLSFCFFS